MNRLRAVLDASGSFTNFATEYLRANKVTGDFEVTPQVLDEFQVFLSERHIQPGVAECLREREFIGNRLKIGDFQPGVRAWKRAMKWRRSTTRRSSRRSKSWADRGSCGLLP